MGVYRKTFETEDEYEAWTKRYGDRITVLAVSSIEAPPTLSGLRGRRSMMVMYQSREAGLAAGEGPRDIGMGALAFTAVGLAVLIALLYAGL
ncbi:MAG: hypothetical protein ACREQB_03735 [Candidatus Binataceae bacterium]